MANVDNLCTVAQVKRIIETTGRWTDAEIEAVIVDVDKFIYMEGGTPLGCSWSMVGRINSTEQGRYFVGERKVYRFDNVYYGTATKTKLTLTTQYQVSSAYGMVEILPLASSAVTLDTTSDVVIEYVPKIYNDLSLYRTCKRLLDKTDMGSKGKPSKESLTVENNLSMVENILMNKVMIAITSDYKYYDKIYGVNSRQINQDHDKNLWIGGSRSDW